jgi:aspartate/methionine/tyrosine aminotransferase
MLMMRLGLFTCLIVRLRQVSEQDIIVTTGSSGAFLLTFLGLFDAG